MRIVVTGAEVELGWQPSVLPRDGLAAEAAWVRGLASPGLASPPPS
jgi:hypothetical protein